MVVETAALARMAGVVLPEPLLAAVRATALASRLPTVPRREVLSLQEARTALEIPLQA
jgi:hypothetical protein